jgi:hypothetical protein
MFGFLRRIPGVQRLAFPTYSPPDLVPPVDIESTPIRLCHQCGSPHVHRSRTRGFERWLKRVRRTRPYRCHDCRWRGWL